MKYEQIAIGTKNRFISYNDCYNKANIPNREHTWQPNNLLLTKKHTKLQVHRNSSSTYKIFNIHTWDLKI